MELRDKIAEIIAPLLAEDDWGDGVAETTADSILALPEIADALRACSDGGELDVYRANCEFPD